MDVSPRLPPADANHPYRVMVVDDSAVIRGLLTRALESDPGIVVVSSVGDGQMAVNALQRHAVDVIVLDIEMPVMDGLTAIPKLLAVDPAVRIIMASTLTLRGAEVSLKALQLGAADYVPKPTTTRAISAADDFKRDLVEKVKALAVSARASGSAKRHAGSAASLRTTTLPAPKLPAAAKVVTLRPLPNPVSRPDVIAIGSSTGGPQALFTVLGHLKGVPQPILITQHMPATFTTILAEHIQRQCGLVCAEAKDGEPIAGQRAYVAPGDFHMLVANRNGQPVIQLTKDPPENFCRPAVDPMLRSIVQHYGRRVLATVLTGMGQDGMRGCEVVASGGGVVVAQDEASSVVWGMPGAVATAGHANKVLPLTEIGPYLRKAALGAVA
ncbi:MAG TPA: chemotaxis response regulator protein-glutamate methylesterase [Azospirillaceae bacterium]|nr:chemotaxis response regulator protein-glutamate methylesterase [Azospirillaceae bacterium]